jgi:hypothetical protein
MRTGRSYETQCNRAQAHSDSIARQAHPFARGFLRSTAIGAAGLLAVPASSGDRPVPGRWAGSSGRTTTRRRR